MEIEIEKQDQAHLVIQPLVQLCELIVIVAAAQTHRSRKPQPSKKAYGKSSEFSGPFWASLLSQDLAFLGRGLGGFLDAFLPTSAFPIEPSFSAIQVTACRTRARLLPGSGGPSRHPISTREPRWLSMHVNNRDSTAYDFEEVSQVCGDSCSACGFRKRSLISQSWLAPKSNSLLFPPSTVPHRSQSDRNTLSRSLDRNLDMLLFPVRICSEFVRI